jgi:uncharacterized protein YjbI with pentapeptide repeats
MDRDEFLAKLDNKDSMSGVYLDGSDFSGIEIAEADLSESSLIQVNLSSAKLEQVSLAGTFADLMTARKVRFIRCDLASVPFKGSRLDSAQFFECNLEKTSFRQCVLQGAQIRGGAFRQVNLSGAVLEDATLEGLRIEDSGFSEVAARCLRVSNCEFRKSRLYGADLRDAVFENVVFNDTIVNGGDASGATFVSCDLRGLRFGEEDDAGGVVAPKLSGARYDSDTRFPEGFDPAAHGMVRTGKGSTAADELETLEGTFLSAPVEASASIEGLVGAPSWPPQGYTGAEKDRALAERVVETLNGVVESSNVDMPYVGFVLRPEAELVAVLEKYALPSGPAQKVLLGMDPEELEEAEASSDEWWREWHDPENYEKLLRAGTLLAEELTEVTRSYCELGDGWAVSWYWGVSSTGSRVGVLAARLDAD